MTEIQDSSMDYWIEWWEEKQDENQESQTKLTNLCKDPSVDNNIITSELNNNIDLNNLNPATKSTETLTFKTLEEDHQNLNNWWENNTKIDMNSRADALKALIQHNRENWNDKESPIQRTANEITDMIKNWWNILENIYFEPEIIWRIIKEKVDWEYVITDEILTDIKNNIAQNIPELVEKWISWSDIKLGRDWNKSQLIVEYGGSQYTYNNKQLTKINNKWGRL